LRLPEQRAEELALFLTHLGPELGGQPLLLGLRRVLRAVDVLLLQIRAVAVELTVRRLKRRQRRERGLIERSDVGDVGRADRRRRKNGRAEREGERGNAAAHKCKSHAQKLCPMPNDVCVP